jgi:hypothetical protein
VARQVTITLEEWEEYLVDFIRDGYKETTGETVPDEEVIHGFLAFFVIMKASEDLPPEVIAGAKGETLH